MVFKCTQSKNNYIPKLYIRTHCLKQIQNTEFLGLIIDDKLSWKDHVKHVKLKVSQCIGVLYKIRDKLNLHALKTIYFSLIFSYINYCLLIWGSANKTLLLPIFKLQKQFLRLSTYSEWRAPSEPLFKRLNILKFEDVFKLHVAQFVSNCIKRPKGFPKNLFTEFFISNSQIHNRDTRNKYDIKVFNC